MLSNQKKCYTVISINNVYAYFPESFKESLANYPTKFIKQSSYNWNIRFLLTQYFGYFHIKGLVPPPSVTSSYGLKQVNLSITYTDYAFTSTSGTWYTNILTGSIPKTYSFAGLYLYDSSTSISTYTTNQNAQSAKLGPIITTSRNTSTNETITFSFYLTATGTSLSKATNIVHYNDITSDSSANLKTVYVTSTNINVVAFTITYSMVGTSQRLYTYTPHIIKTVTSSMWQTVRPSLY